MEQFIIHLYTCTSFLNVDHWNCDPEEIASEFIKLDSILVIIKILLPIPLNLSYNIRGFINCVTIVKFFIGLSNWFVMTLQQLRRCLLKIGGRSLKNGCFKA